MAETAGAAHLWQCTGIATSKCCVLQSESALILATSAAHVLKDTRYMRDVFESI
jgi:hypothetical protein